MDNLITVYHGSKQIVEIPTFGLGRKNNDFGLGFYCTESSDLAKEWAVSSLSDGFANRYTLDTESQPNISGYTGRRDRWPLYPGHYQRRRFK